MTVDARSIEEDDHLWSVLLWLQPMGGNTLYDEDGQEMGSACGEHNVPPYVPGIRRALQEASEAEVDPEALYRRAVVIYEELDAERRREEPLWNVAGAAVRGGRARDMAAARAGPSPRDSPGAGLTSALGSGGRAA